MTTIQSAVAVLDVVWPEFRVLNGLVFLASAGVEDAQQSAGLDRTGLEALHNHIHILDVLENGARLDKEPFYASEHADFIAAWSFARRVAHCWAAKLREDFPSRRFVIYATRDDNPVVRFHQVHPDEPPWASDDEAGSILIVRT
jgi:hypothetical protein